MKLLAALVLFSLLFTQQAFAKKDRTDKRQGRQSARIKQGRKSGELTKKESKKLRAEGRRIKRAEKHAKKDGKVTRKEVKGLEGMQDKRSRHVAKAKHNDKAREEAVPVAPEARAEPMPTTEVDTSTDSALPVQEESEFQE